MAEFETILGDNRPPANLVVETGQTVGTTTPVSKHQTIIGDKTFIGSNSTLVAPVNIGNNGFIGAGSTITRNVDQDELAVSRAKQRNIAGWKRPQKESKD